MSELTHVDTIHLAHGAKVDVHAGITEQGCHVRTFVEVNKFGHAIREKVSLWTTVPSFCRPSRPPGIHRG